MDDREMMRTMSVARVGFGVMALLAPRALTRLLMRRGVASRSTSFLVRLWGSREVALGMATLHEMETDEPSRRVVELNAAVDAADAVAAVLAWTHLPKRTRLFTLGGALGAVAISAGYLRSAPRG